MDVNGWTPVPRSIDQLLAHVDPKLTKPYSFESITPPTSPAATAAMAYAREHLPLPTFNHSMRVFYYGMPSPLRLLDLLTHEPGMALLDNHGIPGIARPPP